MATLACVAGWAYMSPSIAGATTTGAAVARQVAVTTSAASPWAIAPSQWAVAGATRIASAASAVSTWPIRPSGRRSSTSASTWRRESAASVRGATKRVAEGVMRTCTSAPSARRRRSRSTALKAAIEPVIPSPMNRPARRPAGSRLAGPGHGPVEEDEAAQGEVGVDRVDAVDGAGPRERRQAPGEDDADVVREPRRRRRPARGACGPGAPRSSPGGPAPPRPGSPPRCLARWGRRGVAAPPGAGAPSARRAPPGRGPGRARSPRR